MKNGTESSSTNYDEVISSIGVDEKVIKISKPVASITGARYIVKGEWRRLSKHQRYFVLYR